MSALLLVPVTGLASAAAPETGEFVDADAPLSLNAHIWCAVTDPAPPFRDAYAVLCAVLAGAHKTLDKFRVATAKGGDPFEDFCRKTSTLDNLICVPVYTVLNRVPVSAS